MEIPDHICNIVQKIVTCEDQWKALYMGVWGCANFYLKPKYENTRYWEQKVQFGLPASKKGIYEYVPKELYRILTSKDNEFTLGHLQTLFSLLEELVTDLCPLVCNGQEIKAGQFPNLRKFLLGEKPYDTFKPGITTAECDELGLAKETRNCFIHNGSKIDEKWLKAFRVARKIDSNKKENDELPVEFHEIEDWHQLIVNITNKLKVAMEKVSNS